MKNVVIAGSTGSIGKAALDVISRYQDKFSLYGIAGNTQQNLLIKQIKKYKPRFAVFSVGNTNKTRIDQTTCFYGEENLEFFASVPDVDIIIMAISGLAGLSCVLKALDAGKTVALATKEIIVCAGHLLSGKKGKILPIDSEHNAIFQILDSENSKISRIVLTASGGPLLNYKGNLKNVTVKQVLKHPVWKMGKRITVDSATMMNKGLEIIEAFYLFGIEKERIDVVLHPQAVVHGFVQFCDGFVKAVLSLPDMRYSINYCLNYPIRSDCGLPEPCISQIGKLSFYPCKKGMFPCLDLAKEALKKGGSYLTALNAADEEAVKMFFEGGIGFDKIPVLIERVLGKHTGLCVDTPGDIFLVDAEIKKQIRAMADSLA
ncbi:MAG TPA: 1-deoxy-D-xylulose-5-phosphate reductoisomerase [bacterium]|nr:1-deoxy-D-xylulose-5-phosphate reductoisomerase [bacterium]